MNFTHKTAKYSSQLPTSEDEVHYISGGVMLRPHKSSHSSDVSEEDMMPVYFCNILCPTVGKQQLLNLCLKRPTIMLAVCIAVKTKTRLVKRLMEPIQVKMQHIERTTDL